MRILFAVHQIPPLEVGGVGLFTVHLAGVMARAGHEVILLAGSEERVAGSPRVQELAAAAPGVRTLGLARPRRGKEHLLDALVDPAVDAALRQTVDSLTPDVLHIQHTLQLSGRLAAMGRSAGAAVVASVHDYWPICQRIVLRRPDGQLCEGPMGGLRCAACLPENPRRGLVAGALAGLRRQALGGARLAPYLLRTQLVQGAYAGAQLLTCPSPSVARLLSRAGFPAQKMVVVDYGIPPLLGVATVPRPRRPFRLGYLGTLGDHKGVMVALEALRANPRAGWELHVHGGPLRDGDLRRELEAAGEDGLATYHGPFTEHHLPGILAELDALVIPSLWRETGPMVWMEAVSAGLPVIASRLGALAERVRHGEDGQLFEPGDPGALAAAVEQTMTQYQQLRHGVMERTVRTVEDAAGEFLALYGELR